MIRRQSVRPEEFDHGTHQVFGCWSIADNNFIIAVFFYFICCGITNGKQLGFWLWLIKREKAFYSARTKKKYTVIVHGNLMGCQLGFIDNYFPYFNLVIR